MSLTVSESGSLCRSRLVAILALAVILRLGLFLIASFDETRFLRPDSHDYLDLARVLVERHEFCHSGTHIPETTRTPGYPMFLALVRVMFGPSLLPVALIQILLSTGTCVLTYLLGSRILPLPGALLAALLVAIDGPSVFHSLLILSETLFTFLLTLAFLLLWNAKSQGSLRQGAAGGLSLGLSILVRPIALYLIPLACVWIAFPSGPRHRSWCAEVLVVTLAMLVFPVGWMARNWAGGVGFGLSTIEGMNTLGFRAGYVLALKNGVKREQAADALEERLKRGLRTTKLTWDAQTSRAARSLAMDVMLDNPWETARVFLDGAMRFWVGPGNTDLTLLLGTSPCEPPSAVPTLGSPLLRLVSWIGIVCGAIFRLVMLTAMAIGFLRWTRSHRWPVLFAVCTVLAYFTILSASPAAYARLRVPVTPIAAVCAAAAFVE